MKRFISLLTFSFISIVAYSQIPVSGNNYHWYGPNTNWGAYLQVGGQSPNGNGAAVFTTNGNLHLDAKNGNSIYLSRYTPGNIIFNVGGGKFGIGTEFPSTALEILGSDDVQLTISSLPGNLESSSVVHHTSQGYSFIGQSGAYGRLLNSANSGDFVLGHRTGGAIILSADAQHQEKHVTILETGNVGIGTDNPGTAKLAVDGKIASNEVVVEINPGQGPDYVFEQDYDLRTLKETKQYISENKHLPEIPSAKEMEENGVGLADMNMRLLRKIEELTLYQIELMEKLELQNSELQDVKKELQELKK